MRIFNISAAYNNNNNTNYYDYFFHQCSIKKVSAILAIHVDAALTWWRWMVLLSSEPFGLATLNTNTFSPSCFS